jgi:hypothetical protein
MPLDPKRVQAVFLEAANCHDRADRAAILNRECMGDSETRKRIEVLLSAHDRINDFVNQPLVGPRCPGYAVIPGSRNPMRSTPFITTPYTIDEIIDEYVFYLIEQGTNKVYTVNGLAVFDPSYGVIRKSRLEAERTTRRFLEIRACRISELLAHA